MPNILDTVTGTQIATLIKFSWGDPPKSAAYARWTGDIAANFGAGAEVFASTPVIEVDYNDQHGGVDDAPIKLTVPSTISPVLKMIGQIHAPVTVDIRECNPLSVGPTLRAMFKGKVDSVRANPSGRAGVAVLEIAGWKKGLNVPLGFVCDTYCDNTFGDINCAKSLGPLKMQGAVVSIARNVVGVSSKNIYDGPADAPYPTYWRKGSLYFDGLAISIRSWARDTSPVNLFALNFQPPDDWLGQTVVATPGCDQTLTGPGGCRFWENEEHFNGIGIGMLNRNPLFESDE